MKLEFGPNGGIISRRGFLGAGLTIAALGLYELKCGGGILVPSTAQAAPSIKPAAVEGSDWPIAATQEWFPVDEEVAKKKGIQVLDDPNGALAKYIQTHKETYGADSEALKKCQDWSNRLRKMMIIANGYCARAAGSRNLFDKPPLETANGYTYAERIALLAALATQAVPLGLNSYQWDSDAYRGRLDLFADGTARWPFIVNRPKPAPDEQTGGDSFVDCRDVSHNRQLFWSSDYNWPYNWFSYRMITMTYDFIFPIKGQIPEALIGEVDYWQNRQSSKDILIPVDFRLVFNLVYGNQAEDYINNFMVRTNRVAMRAKTLSIKDFRPTAELEKVCMDSSAPNFITKLYQG